MNISIIFLISWAVGFVILKLTVTSSLSWIFIISVYLSLVIFVGLLSLYGSIIKKLDRS